MRNLILTSQTRPSWPAGTLIQARFARSGGLRQGREEVPVAFDAVENLARVEPKAVRITASLAVAYLIPGDGRRDGRARRHRAASRRRPSSSPGDSGSSRSAPGACAAPSSYSSRPARDDLSRPTGRSESAFPGGVPFGPRGEPDVDLETFRPACLRHRLAAAARQPVRRSTMRCGSTPRSRFPGPGRGRRPGGQAGRAAGGGVRRARAARGTRWRPGSPPRSGSAGHPRPRTRLRRRPMLLVPSRRCRPTGP